MNWDQLAADALAVVHEVLSVRRSAIEQAAQRMAACIRQGGKVLVCGNGGSAADAQHLAAEIVNRFLRNRPAWPAIALTTDTSVLTSIGNDTSFDRVFERQVEALGRPGDVLIAISTSGTSPNIVRAADRARALGLWVLGIGGAPTALATRSDLFLGISASPSTPRIQEGHQLIIHALCELLEELLCSESAGANR
jgi:D-sedoheptulose 7-phosphate isomerase